MLPISYLIIGLLVYYIYSYYRNVCRYPKGPFPLPFIGNALQLDACQIEKSLAELSKTYGNVFTIFIPKPIVVIMNYELIKDAFATRGDDFVGRSGVFPDTLSQSIPNGGVIISDGPQWKENRRVSLHILRDFGMGKNLMEELVKDSFIDMDKYLQELPDKEKGVNMRMPIQVFVANIIHQTLFGYRNAFNDHSTLMKISDILVNTFEEVRGSKWTFIFSTFPWMRYIPILGERVWHRHFRDLRMLIDYCAGEVRKVMSGYTNDQEPTCFVQAYMQRMHKNEAVKDELEEQCLNVATDFFLAGMETTSTTLRWAFNYMAAYPDVQARCRQEILSIVGSERLPSLADKNLLPYTNATVLEIQRMANIIAFNVLHKATCDTHIDGKPVPKDTLVVGQIHHIHINDPVYPDPEEFRPERFLMQDMKTPNKQAVDRLSPFSIGKRQCAGEGLARVELFIGFAGLIQRYKFSPLPGEKINLTPIPALVMQPRPHLFVVEAV